MEEPHAPELVISHEMGMLKGSPEDILKKRRKFIGTAALVEDLMPYYDHAKKYFGLPASQQTAVQKFANASVDAAHLPEAKIRTIIAHLSDLQFSADGYEAQGEMKRAEEVRDVAEILYTMLKTIQLGQNEHLAAAAKQANGNRTRSGS